MNANQRLAMVLGMVAFLAVTAFVTIPFLSSGREIDYGFVVFWWAVVLIPTVMLTLAYKPRR